MTMMSAFLGEVDDILDAEILTFCEVKGLGSLDNINLPNRDIPGQKQIHKIDYRICKSRLLITKAD